jgi:DNA-3-methyladenine glycosylase II
MPRVRLREQRTLRPRGVARTFSMQALPPFRLDLTASALRRRPDNAVDVWDGRTYRRVLTFEGEAIELAAVQAGSSAAPRLMVTLTGAQLDQQTEEAARAVLARLLGLELDLFPFYQHAEGDPLLRTLAVRFRGLKPPRFPTLFECLVNAIACQQLTLTVGIRLLNRLAEAYGTASGEGTPYAFPLPTQLAGLTPETLRPLGFSGAKARSIVELAAAISAGTFDAAAIETLDDRGALAALLRLRGVGRWTAEYALLRGLGRLHVFPGDDVGARNNLVRWLGLRGPLDYAGVQSAVHRWQPFAGLVYFHLLLANLAEHGILPQSSSV